MQKWVLFTLWKNLLRFLAAGTIIERLLSECLSYHSQYGMLKCGLGVNTILLKSFKSNYNRTLTLQMNKLLLLNYSLQQHGTDLGEWGLNWERYFKRVLICLGNIRSRLIWQWLIWLNTPEFVIKHNICIHIGRNNIGGITQGISKFIGPLGDMKNIVLITFHSL